MTAPSAAYRKLSPLGWLAWAVYALEGAVFRAAPPGEEWPLLFRMLWSFDRFSLSSYRESLLLAVCPEVLLAAPYRPEDYVDRPHMQCHTREDLLCYEGPEWLDAPWPELLERLPKNEFGYLHPGPGSPAFLGISQETHRRLERLYRQSPAPVLEQLNQVMDSLLDFTLDAVEGGPAGYGTRLWQEVSKVLSQLPPAEPFRIYRTRFLEKPPEHADCWLGLGRPRPREALELHHLYV